MMSQTNQPIVASSHRPRSVRAWLAGALLMLVGHAAFAEPVKAMQALQSAKSEYQILKINYQIGKSIVLPAQRVPSFVQAHYRANITSQHLARMGAENADTLRRGLCSNCAAQRNAVRLSEVAITQIATLRQSLMILIQVPSSQADMVMADLEIHKLNSTLANLEQAMVAAQD